MTRDNALRKISFLQRKTREAGCTPHEVESAQNIIRNLRRKYVDSTVTSEREQAMRVIVQMIRATRFTEKGLEVDISI
jgi:uncharacterized protein YnzC (UPF0291/DUF896 family)